MPEDPALEEKVAAFLAASIGGRGGALRLLMETPEIADSGLAPALVLGEAARVRELLARDPDAAVRPDPRTGWTALHVVAASRWHRIDPPRAEGLLDVAKQLLDAGAQVDARIAGREGPACGWPALRCAVAGAANPLITQLLLEHGAVPEDEDVYLACFGGDDHRSLRLLLAHVEDPSALTALAAPISTGDTEAVRLLLEAGADTPRALPGDLFGADVLPEPPIPPVAAAIRSDSPAELIELLLTHGADPDAPGQDGISPYRAAVRSGRTDLVDLLARHGARTEASTVDHFLSACRLGDHAAMDRILREEPQLMARLTELDHVALVEAAAAGRTESVRLMLDAGFPIGARGQDGGTALHAAAYAGAASTVELLVQRGADLESRDTTWNSTPLEWAKVGNDQQPGHCPEPDYAATMRTLIECS